MTTQNSNKLHQETFAALKDKIKAFDKSAMHHNKIKLEGILDKLERSLDRLYDAYCLSLKDYKSLLDLIMNRREKHIFLD